ncbi:hypothetical protein WR25_20986 [Diploscapter pachys]|uniref:Uncharacterized protein n=1 Tax=Diploscapter pachys TaxID=2018661 RepID=A0A2A2JX63_9BILA|nr:hypothetical protein WR25_20986 [Diploscapter pachys]
MFLRKREMRRRQSIARTDSTSIASSRPPKGRTSPGSAPMSARASGDWNDSRSACGSDSSSPTMPISRVRPPIRIVTIVPKPALPSAGAGVSIAVVRRVCQ